MISRFAKPLYTSELDDFAHRPSGPARCGNPCSLRQPLLAAAVPWDARQQLPTDARKSPRARHGAGSVPEAFAHGARVDLLARRDVRTATLAIVEALVPPPAPRVVLGA